MTGIHITIGVVGVIALLILWKVMQNHLRSKRREVLMREPIDKGFPAFIEKKYSAVYAFTGET